MKAKVSILAVIMALIVTSGLAQEKSKKQIKEEEKIEKQKQVEEMMNSKTFDFEARTAIPTGYKSINLATTTNYVKYQPELIDSYMPFYGKAYAGIGYGNDGGMKFTGKPEEFTITKGKKNYQVNATVKGQKDSFTLSLLVGFEGSASLTITSNTRSPISYSGEIKAPEKKDDTNN